MSKTTRKFYRPGTLQEKGTKISLKTQPYINDVIFDTNDPITSFHCWLMAMKEIVDEYEQMRSIPGIDQAVPTCLNLNNGITGKVKLLLDFLAQSPIEIILKSQEVDNEILQNLEIARQSGLGLALPEEEDNNHE